ncbi:hypothetical protein EKH57_17510 (plasmid) [Halorubrum sp. BOL3-1]|uniref:hypothetical protein n=1 Tax=Halorubrum sp. BOL3-1 TaxID=2497325 RepID=UPI001004DC95|nr:hypothetical protein [Halorubrum sp. BOL3-1]QAU14480.1 hypothetical protein EKH57_17510 [Halorubrum sp. BOL3-1]
MVKIPEPHNLDEIKKRGSTNKHIVKRVADTSSSEGLDSDKEDKIFEVWVESIKPEDVTRFDPYQGRYPAISGNRLQDHLLVYKEVELGGYRIDSIIRHSDSTWELVEVKTEAGLNLGVIGHLLSKRAQFEDIFQVKPEKIKMTVLTNGRNGSFQTILSKVNKQYSIDVGLEEIQI